MATDKTNGEQLLSSCCVGPPLVKATLKDYVDKLTEQTGHWEPH